MARTPRSKAATLSATAARNAAVGKLIAMFPTEFYSLYDQERMARNLPAARHSVRSHVPPAVPLRSATAASIPVAAASKPEVVVKVARPSGQCAHMVKEVLNGGIVRCTNCKALRQNGVWRQPEGAS